MNIFLITVLGVYVLPLIALAFAHGQSTSTVPELSPNPNLQFLPQRAYIITQTPGGQVVQAVPVQNDNDNDLGGQVTGIIGILTAVGAGLWAKLSGSKDVKQTNAALLNTKEVTKELARVMFNFQPEQSKALSDAPAIKLQTLEDDKKEFADKVAKS